LLLERFIKLLREHTYPQIHTQNIEWLGKIHRLKVEALWAAPSLACWVA